VPGAPQVRLAEVVGALSLATDVGMGAPLEIGLGTSLVATRLAEALGCSPAERRRAYWVALLRHIGCTAGSHEFATLVGDELAFRGGLGGEDFTDQRVLLGHVLRAVGGDSAVGRVRALARFAANAAALKEGSLAVCEVASRLADALGFEPEVRRDITGVYERWDGRGFPSRIPAERVSVPARVVAVAETAEILTRLAGLEGARAAVAERAGRAFDPEIAACFRAHAPEIMETLDREDLWGEMLAAEPGPPARPDADGLERALRAVGDFADLKSPYTVGHSRAVADLARDAAVHAALDEAAQRRVLLAGLVHDVGRVGVSSRVWGKEAPLSRTEWEQVRLHPYTTERVLDRASSLREVVAVAAAHHERLDGSGYHRGVPASVIARPARLLAAADAFHAMTEPRPHRPALTPEQAGAQLRREAREGRLDADAVEAVLAAAGRPVQRRRTHAGGLTPREVEVLRLLARGLSIRAIAAALTVAPKTVDAHIQHIYAKAGVSTRAAATLFAAENDLLETL
jgi:HD-GYP domain-containing protein (c-di-GMP phosphodiesterase class II)